MPQKKRGQTPVEEAVARILNALDVPEKTEEIPLLQALGRVAAGDVCARVAQPPFDRSALDGYALRAADIAAAGPETPVTLPVSRYLCAGSDPGGPLAPGTAARIMTGAPVPAGADCVLRQEDTESNGQTVTFHAPVEARANVCFAGEDIAPGKCLVPAGTRLDEVSLGLLAGQGVQTVTVYAKPRAALMPTGDELCSPETPLRPGKIYDSNGPMLAARMLRLGAEPTLLAAGPDDPAALAAQAEALLNKSEGFALLDGSVEEPMKAAIRAAGAEGDSVGGVLETAILGLPAGVGEPYFDSVESKLAHLAFSIPAVKGIEFGSGFGFADQKGSEANDAFRMQGERIVTATNHNAGLNGGISNGMPVVFRTAVKPTPSIYKTQDTVDYIAKKDAELSIQGRHDPCIVPRAAIVQTCAAALAVGDLLTAKYGMAWMEDPTGYRKEVL